MSVEHAIHLAVHSDLLQREREPAVVPGRACALLRVLAPLPLRRAQRADVRVPAGAEAVGVQAQTFNMPSSNVLLYEPLPVHQGRSTVLFLSGQMDLLSPEVLREAVEATRAQIRAVH